MPPPNSINEYLKWIQLLFYLVAFVFLFHTLTDNIGFLKDIFIKKNIKLLSLSLLFYILSHCFAPLCSKFISKFLQIEINYSSFLAAHIVNLPSKYIPGGIWHTAGRIGYLSNLKKKSLRKITLIISLENLFALATGVLLACITLHISSLELPKSVTPWISNIIPIITALILFVILLLVTQLRITKEIFNKYKFRYNYLLETIITYALSWSFLALSFTYYIKTITSNHIPLVDILASYFISWLLGFIAIFAPQGIGIFEASASTLLNHPVSSSQFLAALFAYRILIALADTTTWGIYHIARINYEKN